MRPERRPYLGFGRVGGGIQQGGGCGDEARGAEAALQGLLFGEAPLHGVLAGKALHGDDGFSGGLGQRQAAGRDGFAVDDHFAGPALLQPAGRLGGHEPEIVAQKQEQRGPGVGIGGVVLAVDVERDWGHRRAIRSGGVD